MLAENLIENIIPNVKTSDTGDKVLSLMEMYKVSHLPIVNNLEFLGLISDSDIYNCESGSEALGNCKLSLVRPFVYENQHIFEIIELVSKLGISIVPVLSKENHYLGAISQLKLVKQFAKMISIEAAGAIIILETTILDYSLTEIAQIVESNNSKILSLYISSFTNSTKINITMKIDLTETSSVIKTFERYGYDIKAYFLSEDMLKSFYDNRYDAFLCYLNV